MALAWKLHHFKRQMVTYLAAAFTTSVFSTCVAEIMMTKMFLMVLVTQVSPAVLHCKGPSQLRSCRVAGNACPVSGKNAGFLNSCTAVTSMGVWRHRCRTVTTCHLLPCVGISEIRTKQSQRFSMNLL